ncbi:MAG: prepilin-type N-terminal cleavage/methylation domain-containing protein [Acidobacteriota bacterium]|jgi:prepilin-type N-terminal cleavage/methylation domain-containing protein|nr:prepilin-type N-terminal cleavage/methylation domain-containing protein [Acidobacteriota bacterium]
MNIMKKTAGRPEGGQSGFTLLEVIIATVILGVGLLAVAEAMTRGALFLGEARIHKIAEEQAFSATQNIRRMLDNQQPVMPESNTPIHSTADDAISLEQYHFTRTVTLEGAGHGTVIIAYRMPRMNNDIQYSANF